MSDFYSSQIHQTRHAELMEQARQDTLARQLPHRPGPLTRLWARLTADPVSHPSSARSTHAVRGQHVRHA